MTNRSENGTVWACKTRTGTVVEVDAKEATVELEDGTREVIEGPFMEWISVEVGMRVSITDTGDGKPIYGWGS